MKRVPRRTGKFPVSSVTLVGMGEWLRRRALRALHLEHWWTHIEALSARLRRLEEDVENLQLGKPPFTPRPQTIRAAPPPPPNRKGDA